MQLNREEREGARRDHKPLIAEARKGGDADSILLFSVLPPFRVSAMRIESSRPSRFSTLWVCFN